MSQSSTITVSIIIPVHNHAELLRDCLRSIAGSDRDDYEVIVVDDCSSDDTGLVAASLGCRVVRQPQRGGPSKARNDGAAVARGEILVFLDADVRIRPDTLSLLLQPFKSESIDAVFGSYDANPGAVNFVSQFRNLLHHYTHQNARIEAATFWTGCGAIRRTVFMDAGGFDTSYSQPSIEDIELGFRLRASGNRIVVQKLAQVTHQKKWTLYSMLECDLLRRGVPWILLIIRDKSLPDDLNVKLSQRASVLLTLILSASLMLLAIIQPAVFAVPLALAAAVIVADARGAICQRMCSVAIVSTIALAGLWCFSDAPSHVGVAAIALAGVVATNFAFYHFLVQARGLVFAINSVPLHLLFYLVCGAAVGIGLATAAFGRGSQVPRKSIHAG